MSQSKKASLIEAIINTFIGYTVTLVCSPAIFWMCNVPISINQIGMVTLLFTILSIIRGYLVRRFFNKLIIKQIKKHEQN